MDRRTYLKSVLVVSGGILMPAGFMALVGRSGTQQDVQLAGFDGHIMGTGYSVRVAPDFLNDDFVPNERQIGQLARQVAERLQGIDSLMSTWKSDSELSRFNRYDKSEWQPLSAATIKVIAQAIEISNRSLGAFDATIGPLVELWGFGAAKPANSLSIQFSKPSDQLISETLKTVGYAGVEVNEEENRVRKINPKLQLDLSGIAKGFAVDQVANLLNDAGVNNYLIEIGGELRAKGQKSINSPWKVAIEQPLATERDALRVLALNDSAVATSGNYRNFILHNEQHYSHVIDPRNGVPVQHDLVSVTVLSDTTMEADALSTALMIMGPGQALSYAQNNNIPAHFVYKTANGVVEHHSAAFKQFIV